MEYSDDNYISDEEMDDLYDEDEEHIASNKEDNTYYIGLCFKDMRNMEDSILLHLSISNKLFLKYDFKLIYKFLNCIENISFLSDLDDILYLHDDYKINIHIMKTNFQHSEIENEPIYNVLIKTFWLKIVQRTWKRVYNKRKNIIKKRCNISNIHHRQIHGKWPNGLNHLPGIRDMNL